MNHLHFRVSSKLQRFYLCLYRLSESAVLLPSLFDILNVIYMRLVKFQTIFLRNEAFCLYNLPILQKHLRKNLFISVSHQEFELKK